MFERLRKLFQKEKNKRKYVLLTKAQIRTIKKLRKVGLTPVEIQRETGIDCKVISYHTRKNKRRGKKIKPLTMIKRMEQLRHRHTKNVPVYHESCPACTIVPALWNDDQLQNWLSRSKQARNERVRKLNGHPVPVQVDEETVPKKTYYDELIQRPDNAREL